MRKLTLLMGAFVLFGVIVVAVLGRESDLDPSESGPSALPPPTSRATDRGKELPQDVASTLVTRSPRAIEAAYIDGQVRLSSGLRFSFSKEELSDGGSVAEMAWLQRNAIAPGELVSSLDRVDQRDVRDIKVGDGLDVIEVERLRRLALSSDPRISAEAVALLREGAVAGSIGALDVIANAFAFGAHRDPVVSEAYTLAAWQRGNANGGLGVGVNALIELDASQRAAASRLATQILADLNAERQRRGWPALIQDPRPVTSSPPPAPRGPGG